MKEENETSLTPLDTIAGGNSLQILKAFLPYLNRQAQMPLAMMIKWMEIQNLRAFFQKSGSLYAQSVSDTFSSPLDMISEVIPYFPAAMREQVNQGLQMMEMMKTVQEMNTTGFDFADAYQSMQSMFSQTEPGKE